MRIVGIRPGEKIHEEMITSSDSTNTIDLGRYFAILPSPDPVEKENYCAKFGGTPVPEGYAYDSGTNPHFLTVEELKGLIAEHVATGAEAYK